MGIIANEISLCPVDSTNWRNVTQLQVTPEQQQFVAEPCYYLALCAYGGVWNPLAICRGDCQSDTVIGFMMWGVDPSDESCWLGGILIDQSYQRRGYGQRAVEAAISKLFTEHGHKRFALSYQPENRAARDLYRVIGFVEADEWEDDEIVARLSL